ncbi:hypothetical protein PGT21_016724 [Puccinia graminis f. sp. tritici]|uniref:Uncharacterized protein n=1 Tax=Puccinia graminis f. sp. tritici TaxID=56615 RepID=A0A5B0NYE2_PUCGR|nr:hypothetical protein PGT21_016724 [Puccinia graminis f. sp. tritici]
MKSSDQFNKRLEMSIRDDQLPRFVSKYSSDCIVFVIQGRKYACLGSAAGIPDFEYNVFSRDRHSIPIQDIGVYQIQIPPNTDTRLVLVAALPESPNKF